MKKLILLLILVFTIQSCENKAITQNKTQIERSNIDSTVKDISDELDENNFIYPKTGRKVADFIPEPDIYQVQYESKGDLNEDGLEDVVIILRNKEIKNVPRPMLVLIQSKDKSYRLDKVSNFVMPIEYTERDLKNYYAEDISIEKGILKIQLYGSGLSGNLFSNFKYFNNELILTYIETYNVGAGSWQQLKYNLENGELIQEITNTMEEEMPMKEKTFRLTKENHKFENTSPIEIIIKTYKIINSD